MSIEDVPWRCRRCRKEFVGKSKHGSMCSVCYSKYVMEAHAEIDKKHECKCQFCTNYKS